LSLVKRNPSAQWSDLPVVEPNQYDDVPVIPELILVDEYEDPKEEEFEKEEEPQEEEDDMEVDIEEDDNELELRTRLRAEDETVPACVHEVVSHLLSFSFERIVMCNEVQSSMEEGMAATENLVRKLGNAEEKVKCKKLKKELEEERGFMFEERPNEAINVPVEDEKSPSSEPRGSPHDS
ncbi:hypothetical protein Tco_1166978, partial [Tanacetum coccineum]